MFLLLFSKQAQKDKKRLKQAGLEDKAKELLDMLCEDPLQTPPPCEKLLGELVGKYSRRINIQHRLVYDILDNKTQLRDDNGNLYEGIVRIKRMWTHYE